jgi:hypothetical protein
MLKLFISKTKAFFAATLVVLRVQRDSEEKIEVFCQNLKAVLPQSISQCNEQTSPGIKLKTLVSILFQVQKA